MLEELDLEDLGGDEIADDFACALVAAIENKQKTLLVYDLDREVYVRITVERITKQEFEASP